MNPSLRFKNYFDLNRSEQRGIVVLVLLILIAIAIPNFAPYFFPEVPEKFAEIEDFSALIRNDTLEPVDTSLNKGNSLVFDGKNKVISNIKPIEINTADEKVFASIPGVEKNIATRIIKFRNLLGGFYSTEQLLEVYGFPAEVYKQNAKRFTVNPQFIKRININSADLDELKKHPYLKYKLSKAIIAYRNIHGSFPDTDWIKKAVNIENEDFIRLKPYLTLND